MSEKSPPPSDSFSELTAGLTRAAGGFLKQMTKDATEVVARTAASETAQAIKGTVKDAARTALTEGKARLGAARDAARSTWNDLAAPSAAPTASDETVDPTAPTPPVAELSFEERLAAARKTMTVQSTLPPVPDDAFEKAFQSFRRLSPERVAQSERALGLTEGATADGSALDGPTAPTAQTSSAASASAVAPARAPRRAPVDAVPDADCPKMDWARARALVAQAAPAGAVAQTDEEMTPAQWDAACTAVRRAWVARLDDAAPPAWAAQWAADWRTVLVALEQSPHHTATARAALEDLEAIAPWCAAATGAAPILDIPTRWVGAGVAPTPSADVPTALAQPVQDLSDLLAWASGHGPTVSASCGAVIDTARAQLPAWRAALGSWPAPSASASAWKERALDRLAVVEARLALLHAVAPVPAGTAPIEAPSPVKTPRGRAPRSK